MIKGTKAELDDIARNYLCTEHQTPVVVAWHAGENCYVLRCGKDHFPEEVTRQPSLTERYKQGEELPEPLQSNVKKAIARSLPRQPKAAGPLTLGGVPSQDLATGEVLSEDQVKALVAYARGYKLDPYRGHLALMYGKPYITIDGYLFHAKKEGTPYRMATRPLTDEERPTYQISEGSHAWVCEIVMGDGKQSFTGLGVVTREEMTAESTKTPGRLRSPVVASHPWQLAQKRAEWQALRRAFPIGETEEAKEE